MKSVLISIKPKYCELIASGKKTVEVRKTKPKIDVPFKCYIYCTKSKNEFLQSRSNMFFYCENKDFIGGHGAGVYQRLNGKVIGEFVCDRILRFDDYFFESSMSWEIYGEYKLTCLNWKEMNDYANGKETLYGWHISNLVIYDKPKELYEFLNYNKYQVCKEKGCFSDDCWICPNNAIVTKPPQSYFYIDVEELGV